MRATRMTNRAIVLYFVWDLFCKKVKGRHTMTKQEEIREGIKELIWNFWIDAKENNPNWIYNPVLHGDAVSTILNYLHSQEVVIVVDGEPDDFCTVEPLIKEKP